MRYLCKNDLYFLMTRVLGYRESDPPDNPRVDPKFHGWLCNELEKPLNTIYLLPRDHTKSTTAGVCRVIQRVLKIENISILLASRTLGRSKALMGEIRAHLSNVVLIFLFPNRLVSDPVNSSKKGKFKWTDEGLKVKCTRVRSDDSVWVTGIGKTITGFHPDEIVLDDIIDQETVATETQSNKSKMWWEYLQPIASTRCIFTILGTFYDDFDLYHELLAKIDKEKAEKGESGFRVIKKPVEDSEAMDGSGKFLYSFYNAQYLAEKREGPQGINNDRVFFNQYYNVTRTDTDKVFRLNYQEYDKYPGTLREYERICTVDPGFSKSKTADNTGITICLYDVRNRVWVEWSKRYKVTVVELLDLLYVFDEEYNFDSIGIESGTWQDAIQDIFNYIISSENRKVLPIFPLKTGTHVDAKYRRIVGTAGYLDKGIVRLRGDTDKDEGYTADLKTEMYYFSSNSRQKDDTLDSFAMQKLIHVWGDVEETIVVEKALSPEEELEQWRKKHDTWGHGLANKQKSRKTLSAW